MNMQDESRKLIALRLRPSVHQQAKIAAAKAGVPLGQWLEEAIIRRNAMPVASVLPKLSPKLKPYFEHFVNNANKTHLHPNDWGHFYKFIEHCHRLQSKLSAMEIKHLLLNQGFSEEYASYLADVYSHGRDIIKVHQGSVPHGADDEWANRSAARELPEANNAD